MKIVVLSSGGLDSSVLLALYKGLGYDVYPLYIYFRNPNAQIEVDRLTTLTRKLDLRTPTISTAEMPWLFGSSEMYVPMRNLVFISMAISYAEKIGAQKVAIGVMDGFPYKDTTKDFIWNISETSKASCGIEVEALLHNANKENIYSLARAFGFGILDTFSCNVSSTPIPCGNCADCQDLKKLITSEIIPESDNPFTIKYEKSLEEVAPFSYNEDGIA